MPSIILAARGRITTHFHQDIGRGFLHRGIDQGHGAGLPVDLEIRAPADGIATFVGEFGSYGLCIFITHTDGSVSVLAHHSKHLIKQGARVKQRQLIAVMGNTGTKFVHSHQELRDPAGNQVDPLLHLVTATAASTVTPASTLLPALPSKGAPPVFKIIRKGWYALVIPAENGKLYALVLGGKDKTSGIPTLTKLDDMAWAAFKTRFVNSADLPS